jgi:hypothetical protein
MANLASVIQQAIPTQHVTPHKSNVTRHTSHVTRHTSRVMIIPLVRCEACEVTCAQETKYKWSRALILRAVNEMAAYAEESGAVRLYEHIMEVVVVVVVVDVVRGGDGGGGVVVVELPSPLQHSQPQPESRFRSRRRTRRKGELRYNVHMSTCQW